MKKRSEHALWEKLDELVELIEREGHDCIGTGEEPCPICWDLNELKKIIKRFINGIHI